MTRGGDRLTTSRSTLVAVRPGEGCEVYTTVPRDAAKNMFIDRVRATIKQQGAMGART
jgi:hypothetical protein